MTSFKKAYSLKIIAIVVSVSFLCTTTLYASPVSGNSLRNPSSFQSKETKERIETTLHKVKIIPAREAIDQTLLKAKKVDALFASPGKLIVKEDIAKDQDKLLTAYIETLKRALQDDDRDIRQYAAWVLGEIGQATEVVPLLEQRLKREKDPDVLYHIVNSISKIEKSPSISVEAEKYMKRLKRGRSPARLYRRYLQSKMFISRDNIGVITGLSLFGLLGVIGTVYFLLIDRIFERAGDTSIVALIFLISGYMVLIIAGTLLGPRLAEGAINLIAGILQGATGMLGPIEAVEEFTKNNKRFEDFLIELLTARNERGVIRYDVKTRQYAARVLAKLKEKKAVYPLLLNIFFDDAVYKMSRERMLNVSAKAIEDIKPSYEELADAYRALSDSEHSRVSEYFDKLPPRLRAQLNLLMRGFLVNQSL